jgi:hypothetical protein
MNPIEAAAEKAVIALLQDVQKYHLEIAKLVTLGKVDPQTLENINVKILATIKFLHPYFDLAHGLIPESMPVLHDVMDWCQDIYHQVYEPILVTPVIK